MRLSLLVLSGLDESVLSCLSTAVLVCRPTWGTSSYTVQPGHIMVAIWVDSRPDYSPVTTPPQGLLRDRVGAVLSSGYKTIGRAFSWSKTERAHLGPRGGRAAGQRGPGVRKHRIVNSRLRAPLDPFDVPCEARAFARIECLSPSRVPRNPSRAKPCVLSTHPFGT